MTEPAFPDRLGRAPDGDPSIEGSHPVDADAFRSAFEDAPIGMSFVDVSPGRLGEFVRANEALAQLTGYSREALVGMAYSDVTHVDDVDEDDDRMGELVAGTIAGYQIEKRYVHARGHIIWVIVTVSLVRSADGARLYAIRQAMDIGARKQLEGQLEYLADHDPLTGLFNRRRFTRELSRQRAYARRYGGGGAVAVLDLDRLKQINDTAGHKAGDDALVETAQMLRDRLRVTDIVARLGGDEFAIALPHTDQQQAHALCEELLRTVREDSGIVVAGEALTLSVGITAFGDDPEVSGPDLLIRADTAMYEAKARGGDACETYEPDVHEADASRVRRWDWSARIRDAISDDTLVVHWQPIVELATGRTSQREALLRMQDADEIILPGAFFPTAERSGLARDLDRWVIHHALSDVPSDPEQALTTINLSGDSVTDIEIPAYIEQELAASGRDPASIVFEVAENVAIANMDRARTSVAQISALGCKIALDHFGAGFGSFYYLKYLPLDFLKIDGEFIRYLAASRVDRVLLTAIVTMAHALGQQVIAEHVEDAATVDILRDLGVDHGQGYHLGRPA